LNCFAGLSESFQSSNRRRIKPERIVNILSEELEKIYPGFISIIDVTDVLSQVTHVRYTCNYRGSNMTWVMTPELMKNHRMVKKHTSRIRESLARGNVGSASGWTTCGCKNLTRYSSDYMQKGQQKIQD